MHVNMEKMAQLERKKMRLKVFLEKWTYYNKWEVWPIMQEFKTFFLFLKEDMEKQNG
jgi:hypothetical protein